MEIKLKEFISGHGYLLVQQVKEWGEILINLETKNKYKILDSNQNEVAFMAEKGGGFFSFIIRNILKSHRPMKINIWNNSQEVLLRLERPFHWFFSDLIVKDSSGQIQGHVLRQFSILKKKYDLSDQHKRVFARIESPIWKLWKFPVFNLQGVEIGLIEKKWGGFLKEALTDADKFQINFPDFTAEEKVVFFAAAVSVDLDFFEGNVKGS